MYRIAIQILSYNRSEYLEQTINSLISKIKPQDRICVVEQSDNPEEKRKCLEIINSYKDIKVIDLKENLGQRGATNKVYESGFFNGSQYVMISDHDNIFHETLDIYVEKLEQDKSIWCASGYYSIEHDIERKDWEWLIKSTARAGHLVFRTMDFLSMMPIDVNYNAGTNCAWFAGLDWYLTWWNSITPGSRREKEFIAVYPGGVEHIGSNSTWQGTYTSDDIPQEEAVEMQLEALPEIIKKYPPQHRYLSYPYSYEIKETKIETTIKDINSPVEHKYNLFGNDVTVFDFKSSTSPDYIYDELKNDIYNIKNINFQDGDIVLDLGANIGMFSIALAKLYPNIVIYAFEPLKVNFDNLLAGIVVNNIKNIIPINCAITKDGRDVVAISSTEMSGGAHVTEKEYLNIINTEHFIVNEIQSTSLTQILDGFNIVKCKLLKIDIEGFEHEVLQNLEVFNRIEYLSGEFHFKGGEELKKVCQTFFDPDKLFINCIAQNLPQPKNLVKILETISGIWYGNKINISDDIKKLVKDNDTKKWINKDKKLHILIPTYQRYEFLRSLLTDTTQQRYKEFDVIICSDGFDPITEVIVKDFDTKFNNKYTYIYTEERANDWGRTPREKLISMIPDNDYVVLIDDDDVICPQYLEKLVDGASHDTISYCDLFLSASDVAGERVIPGRLMDKFQYGYISVMCCLLPIDVVKKCFHKWTAKRDSDFDFIDECTKYKKLKYIPHTLAVAR